MVDLRHLRYFQAVAQELHFGRAAARLRIAQPALSRQIQQLEGEIGTTLLRRTQRRVELLPAGQMFLERSSRILDEVARAVLDARRTGAGDYGRLSVGFIHSSTYGLLPSIIERFRHLHPRIELELHEMPIAEQHVALARGVIDIGLLRPQHAPAELEVRSVLEDPFLVAVSRAHRLAHRTSVRLRELEDEALVMFPPDSSPLFHTRIMAMCERAGFLPRVVQRATQIHTVVGLVGAGIGLAIVPGTARNLQPRGVRFLEIEDRPQPVHVALGWLRTRGDIPAVRSFLEVTLQVAQQMNSGGQVEPETWAATDAARPSKPTRRGSRPAKA
jgi:DNA-binding transcriptional LysR family regulator